MSPRRSSRSLTTQAAPPGPVHTNSSTSSISSARTERNTRSQNKLQSPRTSNPARSQSMEDVDEPAKPPPRRTRSGLEEIKPKTEPEPEDDEEDEGEEEEVTRCICGRTEYPGLPNSMINEKSVSKDNGENSTSSDVLPEDAGGLFIQCDVCKVWQHGGCVGILDEAMSPEEYFCEQCRKDLHKISTTFNGQKYSRYLPVQENLSQPISPSQSPAEGSSKRSKDSKQARQSAEALSHKRRSTMNSREAAYEEEQLRQAIEESKRQGAPSVDDGSKGNKRSRSDSIDRKDPAKRPRNGSNSSLPSIDKANAAIASSSDEALATALAPDQSPKRIRGAAAKNHREKEQREQREKERADAAGRRKARSDRRRGDESDPSEDPPTRNSDPTINFPPSPTTPPAPQDPPPTKTSHQKKTGRPATKRGRVGRNQYTKDRDPPLPSNRNRSGSQLGVMEETHRGRGRSRSHSNARDTGITGLGITNGNGVHNLWAETTKPSKPKHMNPNRASFFEMRKRVGAILQFVNRSSEVGHPTIGHSTPPSSGTASDVSHVSPTGEAHGHQAKGEEKDGTLGMSMDGPISVSIETEVDFGALSSVDMLRVLVGKLTSWQNEFGMPER